MLADEAACGGRGRCLTLRRGRRRDEKERAEAALLAAPVLLLLRAHLIGGSGPQLRARHAQQREDLLKAVPACALVARGRARAERVQRRLPRVAWRRRRPTRR